MQIVGSELVVALKVLVGDVEENGPVDALGALLHDLDRDLVPAEQRGQERSYKGFLKNGGEGFSREKRNQVGDKPIRRRLDDHGQLHGRGLHLHRRLGIGIESAVDDVGPVHEIGYGGGVESKTLLRDHGDKTGAGFEIRIVELAIALVALKVGRVGRREKRTFVMVEPPGDLGRTGVLEIDDGIFVAVEMGFVKKRSGAMQQSGEDEVSVFANALAIKAGEERRGAGSVETLVVVEDSNFQSIAPVVRKFPPPEDCIPSIWAGR